MYLITFPTSFLSYLHVWMNMEFPEFESTIPTGLCTAWTLLPVPQCAQGNTTGASQAQAVMGWNLFAQRTPQCGVASATAVVAPAWDRTKSRKVTQKISSSLY